jgi:hypothetical protein
MPTAVRAILDMIKGLFERRPVWGREPLEIQIASDCAKAAREVYPWSAVLEFLPYVAYK